MTIKGALATVVTAACAFTMSAQADDLFNATIQISERGLGSNGKLTTKKVNQKNIIQQFTGATSSSELKNFAFVYNATADALQVVDSTGAVVTNVIQFGGGAFTFDTKESD